MGARSPETLPFFFLEDREREQEGERASMHSGDAVKKKKITEGCTHTEEECRHRVLTHLQTLHEQIFTPTARTLALKICTKGTFLVRLQLVNLQPNKNPLFMHQSSTGHGCYSSVEWRHEKDVLCIRPPTVKRFHHSTKIAGSCFNRWETYFNSTAK